MARQVDERRTDLTNASHAALLEEETEQVMNRNETYSFFMYIPISVNVLLLLLTMAHITYLVSVVQ